MTHWYDWLILVLVTIAGLWVLPEFGRWLRKENDS